MKKTLKIIVLATFCASLYCTAMAVADHSMRLAGAAACLMLVALAVAAVYTLWKFSIQMARKTDSPEKKRKDGTPAHRLWPMWTFLGFFLVEVALGYACIYFACNMWTVRDLLNFELTAILSTIIVYWFTHGLQKNI